MRLLFDFFSPCYSTEPFHVSVVDDPSHVACALSSEILKSSAKTPNKRKTVMTTGAEEGFVAAICGNPTERELVTVCGSWIGKACCNMLVPFC